MQVSLLCGYRCTALPQHRATWTCRAQHISECPTPPQAALGREGSINLRSVALELQDVFLRRLAVLNRKPGARIAVHMAVAGEAASFRTVEAFSGAAPIDVLPVLTSDIFGRSLTV